jgi:hypothetical protein
MVFVRDFVRDAWINPVPYGLKRSRFSENNPRSIADVLFSFPTAGNPRRYCSLACKQAAYRWRLKENWLEVLKRCPVPMDDVPPRNDELPKNLDLD